MRNKKGLVLNILFIFLLLGVSLPLFICSNKKVKADTITDLTGTTWVLNNTLTTDNAFGDAYINFISNNTNFTKFDAVLLMDDHELYYDAVMVYDGGVWTNQAYRTINIIGGSDVQKAYFISWLVNNATLQTPAGTEVTHRYWAPDGVITMSDNQSIGDNEIEYTVLFNQFTDTYTDTTQTGLIFKGVQTTQTPAWSYIESINGDGINLLYHGTTNNIDNTMWLEFTTGDYIDTDLYNFMSLQGTWFDDANAYLVGINQGYVEGVIQGRALGQADGVEYTGLVTGIFNGLGNLLSIQVFPNITIGLLIGLPLLLGAFIIIIKILRG